MKQNKYDELLKLLLEKGNEGRMYGVDICRELNIDRDTLNYMIGYIQNKKGVLATDGNDTVGIPFDKMDIVKEFLKDGGFRKEERNKIWNRAKEFLALVGLIDIIIRIYSLFV